MTICDSISILFLFFLLNSAMVEVVGLLGAKALETSGAPHIDVRWICSYYIHRGFVEY